MSDTSETAAYRRQAAVMDRVEEHEAERSRTLAAEAVLYAELAAAWGTDPTVVLELAGTLRVGQSKAAGILSRSERLVELFPQALASLADGVLRVGTAELLLRTTATCPPAVQAEVGRRLTGSLVTMDAADARKLIVRTVLEVEGDLELEEAERRHAQARANRGVWVRPVEDGMSVIGACIDSVSARRFELTFAELVRAQEVLDARDGIVRTKAQRQADVLAELPARHLALLRAIQAGQTDDLLAQAKAADTDTNSEPDPPVDADVAEGSEQSEVPVDSEVESESEAGVSSASGEVCPLAPGLRLSWQELAVQLLRLPVHAPTTLYVHTAMHTLLELDQRAGYVEGLGPIAAFHTRLLAPHATLQRLAVDPDTGLPLGIDPRTHPPLVADLPAHRRRPPDDPGQHAKPPGRPPDSPTPTARPTVPADVVVAEDYELVRTPRTPAQAERERVLRLATDTLTCSDLAEPRHDPSRALRRLIEIRDLTCNGPGCSRTARACDLDHETPYDPDDPYAGPTAAWNLGAKSRRCHHAKHHGWTVTRNPSTGISTWQSPTGRRYDRLPVWEPPSALPDNVTLPAARLAKLPHADRTRDDDNLQEPAAQPTPAPAPEPAPRRTSWGADGPPPF